MCLKVVEHGRHRDVHIKEGEVIIGLQYYSTYMAILVILVKMVYGKMPAFSRLVSDSR